MVLKTPVTLPKYKMIEFSSGTPKLCSCPRKDSLWFHVGHRMLEPVTKSDSHLISKAGKCIKWFGDGLIFFIWKPSKNNGTERLNMLIVTKLNSPHTPDYKDFPACMQFGVPKASWAFQNTKDITLKPVKNSDSEWRIWTTSSLFPGRKMNLSNHSRPWAVAAQNTSWAWGSARYLQNNWKLGSNSTTQSISACLLYYTLNTSICHWQMVQKISEPKSFLDSCDVYRCFFPTSHEPLPHNKLAKNMQAQAVDHVPNEEMEAL